MIYSMTITETCTIRQISLGAMKKSLFVCVEVLRPSQPIQWGHVECGQFT